MLKQSGRVRPMAPVIEQGRNIRWQNVRRVRRDARRGRPPGEAAAHDERADDREGKVQGLFHNSWWKSGSSDRSDSILVDRFSQLLQNLFISLRLPLNPSRVR